MTLMLPLEDPLEWLFPKPFLSQAHTPTGPDSVCGGETGLRTPRKLRTLVEVGAAPLIAV